jgi:hypothetical protein
LRVAFPEEFPFRSFTLRLLTPLYHPTVGPAGLVAVWDYDAYSLPPIPAHASHAVWLIIGGGGGGGGVIGRSGALGRCIAKW